MEAQRREMRLQTQMREAPLCLTRVDEITPRKSEERLATTEEDRVLGNQQYKAMQKERSRPMKETEGHQLVSGIRDAAEKPGEVSPTVGVLQQHEGQGDTHLQQLQPEPQRQLHKNSLSGRWGCGRTSGDQRRRMGPVWNL